jgi:hypothetical protein
VATRTEINEAYTRFGAYFCSKRQKLCQNELSENYSLKVKSLRLSVFAVKKYINIIKILNYEQKNKMGHNQYRAYFG